MAWGARAVLASRFDTANATTLVLPAAGTVNLVAGRLYILFYAAHRTGAAPDLSTGFTISYSDVGDVTSQWTYVAQSGTYAAGLRRCAMYWTIPAANHTAITVTMDPTGSTNSNNQGQLIEVASGFHTTTPVAASAVNQQEGSTSFAVNLAGAPAGTALSVVGVANEDETAGITNSVGGLNELADTPGSGTAADSGAIAIYDKDAAVQNTTFTPDDAGTKNWGGVHLEIAAAGGPTVVEGDGSASGAATVASLAAAIFNGVTAAAGVAASAVAGAAFWLAVATAPGVAAGNAPSATVTEAAAVAAGVADASATSATVLLGVASSAGTGVATGDALSVTVLAGDGAAAGVATASAEGADGASGGQGIASGTSTATAVGAATAGSLASAPSAATVSADGAAVTPTVGAVAATGTASGVGGAVAPAAGGVAGMGAAAALAEVVAASIASSAGLATVSGDGQDIATAVQLVLLVTDASDQRYTLTDDSDTRLTTADASGSRYEVTDA